MKFRFLQTGKLAAAENMAIDEAVLENVASGESAPTLRLYGWSPAAVSIGYFQSLEEEIDLMACKRYGIDFVRRQTGGGAVFHDQEITYSIHIPEAAALVPSGILESYAKICGGIIKGLAKFGLDAKFVPLNDIAVKRGEIFKKISGNAQTRKKGVILQHGTILLKVDVDKMFEILKVPSEKLKGKMIENVKQGVVGLNNAAGREISFDEALDALKSGFEEEFSNCTFEMGALGKNEKSLAQKLKKEKYIADTWNKQR